MPSRGPRGSKRLVEKVLASPWAVVALVLVGGALRLAVAGQDLYADELATYWVATAHGFTGVVDTVATTAEITPPLSFLLTWLTTRLGETPELVRLSSLIAGIVSIPLVYAVGARTVGRRAGLLAAALTTLSPFMIFYSTEARGYGVLMALVLLSTFALLHAVVDDRWRWWLLYTASVVLAAYTHYTGVYVVAGQLAWALWAHPRARKHLLMATAAVVVLYLPWLSSLRGDLDSPTTEILGGLLRFDGRTIRQSLGQWSIGFPYSLPRTSLRDLPGLVPMLMLIAGLGIGVYALIDRRRRAVEPADGRDRTGVILVVLLAVATPAATILQSAIGTNVFAVRSLAASWPYLALAVAAVITAARPPARLVAVGLAVAAFAVGAVTMLTEDFQRVPFSELAEFADDHPGAVIVNAAAFTPGPLTNFEVEGSIPDAPIFRLNVPEQTESPFTIADPRPDPADVAERALAEADGGPIIVISGVPQSPLVLDVVDRLDGYEATEVRQIGGLFDVQAVVYERDGAS